MFIISFLYSLFEVSGIFSSGEPESSSLESGIDKKEKIEAQKKRKKQYLSVHEYHTYI